MDLYKLKKFVEEKGGFESVCRQKRWAEIGRDLGYSGKIMSSLSTSLKNSYQKWLQPYEEWLRDNKPNVLQQQELENGGPYTPSPALTPVKHHQHTPGSIGPNSPAIRASAALNASLQSNHGPISTPVPSVEPLPVRPLVASGFTPVNAGGGFTAVNAPPPPSSFSAINVPNGYHPPNTGRSTPQRSEASPMTSAKNTPDMRPFGGTDFSMTPSLNGQPLNPLKRQLSSDADSGSGDADASGRRSKRHRAGEFFQSRLFRCCPRIECLSCGNAGSRQTLWTRKANLITCRCCAYCYWLLHDPAPPTSAATACSSRSFN